jgi:predicted enzyme related to lactoylglutathione lyase
VAVTERLRPLPVEAKLTLAAPPHFIYFGTKIEHAERLMRKTGKLDYLELPAKGGTYDSTKLFYARAFGWSFTDYGATYCAFDEGLEGGFQGDESEARSVPLPVLYSENLEETLAAVTAADGEVTREIFQFPGGRRFHFRDPAGNEMAVWGE